MPTERAYWFAWSQVSGLGPILQKRLANHFGSLEAAWTASAKTLQQVEGIGSKVADAIAYGRSKVNLACAEMQTGNFVTPADAAYPQLLFEIPDPPPVLYYQGKLELLSACNHQPAVGIVGTRSPSEYGKRWTRRLTRSLCRAEFLIISGLAAGIDREAHQSTLQVEGQTIAVLGTGVDVVYPFRNQDLHQAIAQSGLLVSEHPPGTAPDKAYFPRRNRVIAGLCRALLVTEAPRKSGALITARLANDYGRDVFALPGSLDNLRCHGCLDLLNQGAQMVLGDYTLIDALGAIPIKQSTEVSAVSPDLPPPLQQVFQAITLDAMPLDAIVQQIGDQSTGDILSALTQLELMGLIYNLPGTQQYQRCHNP